MRAPSHHALISPRIAAWPPRGFTPTRLAGANPHWLAQFLWACVWLALWTTAHRQAVGADRDYSTGRASVAVGGQALAVQEITTFRQFYQLSLEQSSAGRPVRIQGVVLCYDLDWGQLYIHDGSETRWFNPREISTQPARPVEYSAQAPGQTQSVPFHGASGQLVEVTGTTTVVGKDNALTNVSLTILKPGVLPVAKTHALAQLTNDLGQWVETSGRVRVVDFSLGRMQLALHDNGQSCGVFVMGVPQTNELERLLGAKVRVRGINHTKVAGGRLELASVFVPGMDQITILEPAGGKQVLPPATSIDSLLSRELGDWTNRLVRVNGLVVSSEPGKMLTVKDPTGVIRAQVIQSTVARNDDRADVSGFLRVTRTETFLSDAWFEVIKPTPLAAKASTDSRVPAGKVRTAQVLTNVSEILKLRREDSSQRWPVRLRGVVLYADPEWRNGFLRDQGGAIYFDLNQKDVRSGQWVELTGETGPGGFAPEIVNASVKVLGTTNLPTAARMDMTDLADGHLDAQWVEMEGVIRRVKLEAGHLRLLVMTPRGKFDVLVPGLHNQTAPTHLIDAFVSIQGACALEKNARQQMIGATLHVPGLEQIKILEPAPADPFAVAATPIISVATFNPDRLAGRRVKVSGVVTLKIPDQGFFVQDAEGGIRVRHQPMNELQPGDLVDVLGFPALGDFSPELEEVSFRRTGNTSNIMAHATTAEEIFLQGAHDGRLVTLEARLLQSVPRSANPQLVLQDGSIIFTARLEDAGQGWKLPALASGSVVRLSGVCSIQRGEQREPKSFRLRLRSPADVTLISSPPWWNAQHTIWVLGGLGAVFVISLAWVAALRRQVAQQTSKLREQIAARERMQRQIEKSHKELLHASRLAGMAEIATNVLHNVGNVLNSVNVSASVVTDRLQSSKADGLARLAELLERQRHDLPGYFAANGRPDQVINFLRTLAQHLASERKVSLEELAELTKHIGHIKEIVAMQQSYARVSGVTELVNVRELVEDALRMNDGALARHGVQLLRDYPVQLPAITVDKHKVLQILVNLIRNAKYACDDSHAPGKSLTLRVTHDDHHVRIAVVDNGVGIPPENLTRIFSHGFTTRKNGHGFGLHSGALATRELGGSLTVQSDGPGRGATFTLELPTRPKNKGNVAENPPDPTTDSQLCTAGHNP